jgi:hypothetical protein
MNSSRAAANRRVVSCRFLTVFVAGGRLMGLREVGEREQQSDHNEAAHGTFVVTLPLLHWLTLAVCDFAARAPVM